MWRLVDMGFDVGVNGCSMKTEENIEVVKNIPLNRLQIETDGPWCEMRASHASMKYRAAAPPLPKSVKKEKWEKGMMVKGRNEPVGIVQVAYAVAAIKSLPVEELCEASWKNSVRMFGLGEQDNAAENVEAKDTWILWYARAILECTLGPDFKTSLHPSSYGDISTMTFRIGDLSPSNLPVSQHRWVFPSSHN